jgi:hypothetical protein
MLEEINKNIEEINKNIKEIAIKQDVACLEKETGWIGKRKASCDKCNTGCKPEDMQYIYSHNKKPYYRVCPKCSSLFHDYVRYCPDGYEELAYVNAVKYMFKKDN